MTNKIAVIGGGASGFMSALVCAENGCDVTVLERKDRVLKKVLATGNGRCNFTNINARAKNYYGKNGKSSEFVAFALDNFSPRDVINRFAKMGIMHKVEESGKVYPLSGQASSVVDLFRLEADKLGVNVLNDFEAARIIKKNNKFVIYETQGRALEFDKIIIATGGKASPELGSNGSGYDMLKSFGHKITELKPALVQLKTEKEHIKGLTGIKTDAMVSVLHKNKEIAREQNEFLFTDFGISGSVVFDLSYLSALYDDLVFNVDFLPDITNAELISVLKTRKQNLSHLTTENFLNGILIKKLGQAILKRSGIQKLSLQVSELSDNQLENITKCIKNYTIKIVGAVGFKNAQVTVGGVLTDEFSNKTMESKKVKGLYAAGEVFDVFGDCGGYNLQWAWSSGYLAGLNAAGEGGRC